MNRPTSYCLLVAASLICSCGEPERSGPPSPRREIGDPCSSGADLCITEAAVQRCVDGIWTALDCNEVCLAMGPAYVAGECVEETCECVLADPSGCTPGDAMCESSSFLATCNEAQTWTTSDCDEVCQAASLATVGCMPINGDDSELGDACWCSHEGTPCEAATPAACADEMTLANCVDGAWVFTDCRADCSEGTCVAWESPPTCACP